MAERLRLRWARWRSQTLDYCGAIYQTYKVQVILLTPHGKQAVVEIAIP